LPIKLLGRSSGGVLLSQGFCPGNAKVPISGTLEKPDRLLRVIYTGDEKVKLYAKKIS
jgi:hypothetical protein